MIPNDTTIIDIGFVFLGPVLGVMVLRVSAQVSTLFLGLLFIASGSVKTIKFNSLLYHELLKAFKNFSDVSPIRLFGLKTSPQIYMQTSGVLELICGTALATGTLRSQNAACIGLMCMMFLTSYCHLVLGDISSAAVPIGYLALIYWLRASIKSLFWPTSFVRAFISLANRSCTFNAKLHKRGDLRV
ncbi:hypothetical protein ECG_07426 [Echinococcus granulosus]|nr:hypothetical protein ECG_07426 [Echinococcus granulosus]